MAFAFSVRACCGVMDSYDMGEGDMAAILGELNKSGKIRDGYVMQRDLDAAIKRRRAVA